ncbi:hypothetical protein AWZ03_006199 [Drosophila navojoa]|uniref:Uncharacterized protein n=1 Tax=Drosophila navojoa TaxID=7232 RepID=A0A484BH32_DRONA|nr:hypothetical protein AWZ03_006199 [Drosophila navojoa]
MEHHGSGFVASPWAAVLGHHSMASDAGFAAAAAAAHVQNVAAAHHTHPMHGHPHSHPHSHPHHHHSHPHPHTHSHHHHHHLAAAAAAGGGMPMDLHVPQGFPYYRYREDALCWGDRKSMEEIGAAQSSVNARSINSRSTHSAKHAPLYMAMPPAHSPALTQPLARLQSGGTHRCTSTSTSTSMAIVLEASARINFRPTTAEQSSSSGSSSSSNCQLSGCSFGLAAVCTWILEAETQPRSRFDFYGERAESVGEAEF